MAAVMTWQETFKDIPVPTTEVQRAELEFRQKAHILLHASNGAISPDDFGREVFGTDAGHQLVLVPQKKGREKKADNKKPAKPSLTNYATFHDAVASNASKRNAYTYYCRFFRGTRISYADVMESVFAFCVDLDNMNPYDLDVLVQSDWYGYRPTYAINSGHGCHLIYLFTEPLQWRKRNHLRERLKTVYNNLKLRR